MKCFLGISDFLEETSSLSQSIVSSLPFHWSLRGFPGSSDGKASACNSGDLGSIPGSGRSPGEGNGNPLQYSCHGWWSLVGYSSWDCKESDTTEQIHWLVDHLGRLSYFSLIFFGTLHSDGYFFPFLLCLSFLFFSELFVRPTQTTILPFCISFSWE